MTRSAAATSSSPRLSVVAATILDFDCPRCGATVQEPFYGPCSGCRSELRDRMQRAPAVVEVEAYEPKMNVTPNQVATKE